MSRYSKTEPFSDNMEDWQNEEYDMEDDSMDGDAASALRDAGFGTDEDYGSFGGEDDFLDGSYEE